MAKAGFKITERDVEILRFINDFGFCEMPQLERRFGFKKPRNYQVMSRLIEGGLVKHERVFYGRHGIFRLSERGAKLTELPALARVPLATYQHDLTLIEVYLKLREQYPAAQWVSERQLRRDKYFDGVGKTGHLSDGLLVFPDGKQVAVEVELSLKGKHRLEHILKGYGADFSLEAVWYYCSEGVASVISLMAASWPFVKIYPLREFLG